MKELLYYYTTSRIIPELSSISSNDQMPEVFTHIIIAVFPDLFLWDKIQLSKDESLRMLSW